MPMLAAVLTSTVERVANRRFQADAATLASVATCAASARLIHQMNLEHGLHLDLTTALNRLFEQATAAGHAQADFAAVYLAMSAQGRHRPES
jgi:3-hydroxyisobutyrate dehydrogenase-like beta-hydroxyacid dehydrogenase